MSLRRKLAIASWDAPREGNIYGKLTLDARPALAYIRELREQNGVHVTLTHLVTRALALAMREPLGLNGVIRRGRFYAHSSVDISVVVATEAKQNLAALKLVNVDQKSMTDIAQELNKRVNTLRLGQDKTHKQNMSSARLIPWFLLKPMLRLIGWMSTTMGWSIPALGVSAFPFGTAIITNVGVFGVDEAFVPPTPFAGVPLYLLVGQLRDAPYADGTEVKVRSEVTLTATLDHRFVDGAQAALLANKLREVFARPKEFDLFKVTEER